jgi:hypothetical protein
MTAGQVVESYLGAIVTHDWELVRSLVSEDVVRLGPYGDNFKVVSHTRGPS